MAVADAFPVYYGNTQPGGGGGTTQTGGQVYVPGHEGHGVNLFNIFGSNFNSWLDPLNIAQNYAITPLNPPPAPGFTPGTMPTQNFTNNDFGDFNTPSMQATAGGAHPGILVQPPAPVPAPAPPAPPAPNPGAGPGLPGNPTTGPVLNHQSVLAHNVVSNSHITGLNPSTLSSDYLFSKGGTPHDQLLSGGSPLRHSGFMAYMKSQYMKSQYGQTPNTAISKSGMTVPSSYNTTASTPALRSPSRRQAPAPSPTASTPPPGSSATNTHPAGVPSTKFSGRLALTGGGR